MVTKKDSFTGTTMGGETKAHLDLSIDQLTKMIDMQTWISNNLCMKYH
jgi:hypothetical protein